MPLKLEALARGAASVPRNADDEVGARGIGEADELEPCAVAVRLLRHLSAVAAIAVERQPLSVPPKS